MNRCHLQIAEITIELQSVSPDFAISLTGAKQRFLVGDGQAEARIEAGWTDRIEEPAGRPLFDSGGLWRLFPGTDGPVVTISSPLFGASPYRIARFNADYSHGQVLLRRSAFLAGLATDPLESPLDELLMVQLLGSGRGLEVHASGLVDSDGRGYLFVGCSGAGKTTMARQWEPCAGIRILSDDRVVIRRGEGGYRIHGTPWHGEGRHADPVSGPLNAIFFLRKGPSNRCSARAGADAAAELLRSSFVSFFDRRAMERTLEFVDGVIGSVPCVELQATADRRDVDFIRSIDLDPARASGGLG